MTSTPPLSPVKRGSDMGSPMTVPSSERKGSVHVPGRKEIGDFLVGKVLGEGAFARVFIVRAKDTGKDYAMKVMEKKFIVKEGKSKEVQMERRVLSEVSHPNVVRLFFSFHDRDRLYMILDLCPGGELARLVRHSRDNQLLGTNRALSEDQTRFYMAETISAIQHLHSIGILHRDIKPENILIAANGHVKITDFGTAKDLNAARKQMEKEEAEAKAKGEQRQPRKDTFCGTAEYVSPEVLQDGEAGIGADLWALGIMTHALLVGRTPFICESEFLTFQCILAYAGLQDKEDLELLGQPDSPDSIFLPKKTPETLAFPESSSKSQISTEALDLVKRLLHPDPSKRLGCSDPDELRRHAFFSGLNFAQLDKLMPPALPYTTEYEAPFMDGAKQDWLVTDSGDMYEEDDDLESEFRKKTPSRSPKSPSLQQQRTSSTGRSGSESAGQQLTSGLERFLTADESVAMDGAVSLASYGGLVSTRRHLVLTNRGRALLIDPASFSVKEELVVINAVVTVRANGKDFDIQTPKKTLRLKDLLGSAERWKEAIGKL